MPVPVGALLANLMNGAQSEATTPQPAINGLNPERRYRLARHAADVRSAQKTTQFGDRFSAGWFGPSLARMFLFCSL
jgi:hypothetical protein